MAPKKQQTSSTNPNNLTDISNDFYLLIWTDRSQQKKFKTLNKQPNLQCQQLKNCQSNKILRNYKTSRHLLKRWKDKLLISNGIQDKSLTRESINLNKYNLINDRIQNQEECRFRPFPIRKQKKDLDIVKKNMGIKQTNAIDSKKNSIIKQKEEFKICLRSIAQPTEILYQKKILTLIRSYKDYTCTETI